MIRTTYNILKLSKAMAVGLTLGQLQRTIATRYRESKDDPLYHHWYLALDSLIVASRENFDVATQALLADMDVARKTPVRERVFKSSRNE
jgi:protein involved in polysaccharide export with SLBB domain